MHRLIILNIHSLTLFFSGSARLIDEPVDIKYFFVINGLNMAANVTWSAPFTDMSITGYQVIWNQLQSTSVKTTTYSRIVSKVRLNRRFKIRSLNCLPMCVAIKQYFTAAFYKVYTKKRKGPMFYASRHAEHCSVLKTP
jgi:hypothetical protein